MYCIKFYFDVNQQKEIEYVTLLYPPVKYWELKIKLSDCLSKYFLIYMLITFNFIKWESCKAASSWEYTQTH